MSETHRVACVGASVTFGRGLANRREDCYPAVLGRLLDERYGAGAYAVRNFGYSGAAISRNSTEPYTKTPSHTAATRWRPRTTIVMLGTNDAQFANAAGRATLSADLAALLTHFRELAAAEGHDARTAVFVSQPPPAFPPVDEIDFRALVEEVRPAIANVAAASHAPLIDFLGPLDDRRADFPDGLHPTAAVARRIAEIAFAAIADALEPSKP